MIQFSKSHYDWLDENLSTFFEKLNLKVCGDILAHGDKCYCYRTTWEQVGIPFPHGVAIYLLTYRNPFSSTVRDTINGWVKPDQWVIDNYEKFKPFLPELSDEYEHYKIP